MFEKRLAKIISYLFHPLIIPTYILIIFFNINLYYSYIIPDASKIRLVILVFITSFLFPLLINLVLQRRGFFPSLDMRIKEERYIPFIVTGIFFYLTYYMVKELYLPDFYNVYLLGATILVLIALIINFYWKISLHMLAIGGMTGVFMGLSFNLMVNIPYLLISLIFISGLIGYARLKLGAHRPPEIYVGYLLGFTILFLLLLLL